MTDVTDLSKQVQLLRAMLYVDEFSVDQLQTFLGHQVAASTIRNYIQELKRQGRLEVVGSEPGKAGRPKERLRIVPDMALRKALYEEAYGIETSEAAAPASLTGESFHKARRIIDRVKLKLLQNEPHERLEEELQIARDYLEIAYYEQDPLARGGAVGEMIQQLWNEEQVLEERSRRRVVPKWMPSFIFSSAMSHGVTGFCQRVLLKRQPEFPWGFESSEAQRANIVKAARKVDLSLGSCMTELEAARSAIGIVARIVRDRDLARKPKPTCRLLGELYEEMDPTQSLESMYSRTCVFLLVGSYKKAYDQWEKLLDEYAHPDARTLVGRIKAYEGKYYKPIEHLRVGVATPAAFSKSYFRLKDLAAKGWAVDAATSDQFLLSAATGGSRSVGLSPTLPIEFSLSETGGLEAPIPSRGQSLYATNRAAQLLDVPGPLAIKLAAAFEAAGLPDDLTLRKAVDVCRDEKSVVFVSQSDHTPQDSDLPEIPGLQWLPCCA